MPKRKLKKKTPRPKMGPLWDWSKGVTQSALDLFQCKEQFALSYIEGWTPRAFQTPLEFGSLIHFMLERTKTSSNPEKVAFEVCKSYHDSRKPQLANSMDYDSMQLALTSAEVLFPLYVDYWAEYDSKISWIEREHVFKLNHEFQGTDGRLEKIPIVGMRDGDMRRNGGLGLFETKTKSSINDAEITAGLRADFQTLFYLLSLQKEYKENPVEILYNCIRRPQLRQKKGESLFEYGKRVREDIKDRPEWYFRRYEVTVQPGDIDIFVHTTLDPTLRCMLQWWRSIEENPFERWTSPYHSRNLFRLTTRYGKAPLYNLMVLGRTQEYFQRSSLYPELEESLPSTQGESNADSTKSDNLALTSN